MTKTPKQRMVDRCLWIYSALMVFLTSFAWAIYYLGDKDPVLLPIFDPRDRFDDLTAYIYKMYHLREGGVVLGRGFPKFNYFAPAAYVYAFFLRGFPQHALRAFFATAGLGMAAAIGLMVWMTREKDRTPWAMYAAVATTAVLGFPMIFAVDRGNLEVVVAELVGAGLVLFLGGRYSSSAVFLGLACSIKPFPGIFFLLFVVKKRYKDVAIGVAVAAFTILIALTALGPTPISAYKGLQSGMKLYVSEQVDTFPTRGEGRFEHSLLDTIKAIAMEWKDSEKTGRSNLWRVAPPDRAPAPVGVVQRPPDFPDMNILYPIGWVLGAFVLGFTLIRSFRLPVVNQMIMLATAMTLLPPIATEYTLLHLYVPFGAFLIFLAKDVATGQVAFSPSKVNAMLAIFASLLSPLTFTGRYAGDVKTFLLVALLIFAGTQPIRGSLFHDTVVAPTLNLA